MSALDVNPSMHQFVGSGRPADNASMHKKRRHTPLGRLMDGAGVGDNQLARQLRARGTPIPQSTITRIANGTTKAATEANLKPIAAYFNVTTAHLRGEEGPRASTSGNGAAKGRLEPAPADLSPEAIRVARIWMQLSPGRRAKFLEDISWAKFFEGKFPTYRLGVANMASYEKFERSVEADWEKLIRQSRLPLE
jgi:hypothetical protein